MTPIADEKNKVASKFKEDIFTALGAAGISDEEKGDLLARMVDLVDSRSLDKIIDSLNETQMAELKVIIEKDDTEAWEKFVETNVPHYMQIYQDEAEKLRQEMIIDLGK